MGRSPLLTLPWTQTRNYGTMVRNVGASPKGGFPKGWFWRVFPLNENRKEGTIACSPGTKTGSSGTRVRSHVPPERKPEGEYVRQNDPFTKPPFLSPSDNGEGETNELRCIKARLLLKFLLANVKRIDAISQRRDKIFKFSRRRTNVQQLTCNIDLSSSFYYFFFSFVLIELKPFVLKGKVLGEKF